jgi:ribosomal protein S18 acetylase RimI-like enzyme
VEDIMIIEINQENVKDVNKPNESFIIFGKVIPEFINNCWNITETLLEKPYEYKYPNSNDDYSKYIKNKEKVIYLYYDGDICIGQIILIKYWNKYAYIQDICISKDYRKKGIGHKLMDQAVKWTKDKKLKGIMLETQDVNLAACKFYQKYGFILGGVDTMLYSNFDNAEQKALFWYYKITE